MNKEDLGYTVMKYKDTKTLVHVIDENGVESTKEITNKNNYIMIKDNGDSLVGSAEYFKQLGIVIPKELQKYNTNTTKDGIITENGKGN